ncbi:hypothetical protein EJ04DRAFT_525208 [Polyplosphaeria fusca]|uniref:DUF7820 domain-containing protein n=1 Tax=Polyplosphaeria fusca TaxID=682080 RepID=A0A9P4UZN1_9PLEO|nr:hypothetical protein EJ04DRAFT_525208 [Polyplosphaeria fusca]
MRYPRRSIRSIQGQQLPSIITQFSPRHGSIRGIPVQSPQTPLPRQIEDGIEVVPIEKQETGTGMILTPEDEGKEVVLISEKSEKEVFVPPLPTPPRSLWSRISKTNRILGILSIQVIILIAVGLGLMAAKSKGQQVMPTTTLTPTSEKVLIQNGTFAFMTPVEPQQQNSACLALTNESVAWTCLSRRMLRIQFSLNPSDGGTVMSATMRARNRTNTTTTYGPRPPIFSPAPLTPATDPDYPENGQAYYFRTLYDRTVILKENQIGTDVMQQEMPDRNRTQVKPGERPWLCTFNATVLEGYVYLAGNATSANRTVDPAFSTEDAKMPIMPYKMKLTEMRTRESPQPYCTRMVVGEDGVMVQGEGEGRRELRLHETHSEQRPAGGRRELLGGMVGRGVRKEKRQTVTPYCCRCQYMWQPDPGNGG